MLIVRQSTARTVTVGPVLDSAGAAVTTAVVGDFKISVNGGAPAALNGSATLTHRHTGHYSLALTATDLGTVGQAEVTLDKTTDACAVKELTVVEEAVYDALFAASAAGYQVPIWAAANSTVNLSGTTVSVVGSVTAGVTVTTNNDKTGYSLSQSFPTNFSSLAINASGHVVLQDASLVTAKLGTFALAKTTNITGFNDIAATAIVSAGAITTSSGLASVDVKKINAVTVLGAGTSGDKWGA